MLRTLVALLALCALASSASSEPAPSPKSNTAFALFSTAHASNRVPHALGLQNSPRWIPAALTCCKVCTVGKACGNTCISRDKTCHVGPGCPCDG